MSNVVDRAFTGTAPVGTGSVRVKGSASPALHPVGQYIVDPDLTALGAVLVKYWKIVGDTVVEMSQPEKDSVDAALLPIIKSARSKQIDDRTKELLAQGVEYPTSSGDYYSLSADSMKLFDLMRDAATYPFDWDSVDGQAAITVSDVTVANTLLAAAASRARDIYVAGAAVKSLIRAATTEAGVAAVVDPR